MVMMVMDYEEEDEEDNGKGRDGEDTWICEALGTPLIHTKHPFAREENLKSSELFLQINGCVSKRLILFI